MWHELAFGLESLGLDTPTIRRRVAEMASFFGIENWFYKDVSQLSGGQKQLLNLAAIMAMQPSVLLLDEPTSQLDPIAAADFLATVGRINRELGTTVICTEHRLEEVFPHSHRVLVMDNGTLIADGTPAQVGELLKESGHRMFASMPTPMQVYAAVPNGQHCPVTVRDGRDWLDAFAKAHSLGAVPPEAIPAPASDVPAAKLEEVWFRYEQDSPDITKGLSLEVYPGELVAILGGNGAGKSTTLSMIAGLHKPYRGRIALFGREGTQQPRPGVLGVLPQDPKALFVKNTVGEDLADALKDAGVPKEEQSARLGRVIGLCHLEALLGRHPFDLSGGEQQRAALAKVLLLQPRMLLLDEPTKGLDTAFQEELAVILRRLTDSGVAILMVSHDIGFCARHAHKCALFFDGVIAAQGTPRAFFSGNSFYTTAANRMARHLLPDAVTPEDVISACGGVLPEKPHIPGDDWYPPLPAEELEIKTAKEPPKKLPWWRKAMAGIAGLGVLAGMASALWDWQIFPANAPALAPDLFLIACLVMLALAVSRRSTAPALYQPSQKLGKRTCAALVMTLIAIPLTIALGYFYFGDRRYYLISLLIMAETMLPFFLVFEHRKPQARELILIAVLCAMGVAGRAAFFMLPNFKPVTALVIVSAVALGGETGFLVGALTMLLSNMYFQQGPWTPYQMFAMGIIGLLAGVLFRKGLLRRERLSLSIFGFLATLLVYGGIMNPAAMLMYQPAPSWSLLLAYYIQGLPVDLVHAVSTFLFLWLLSEPMLEKLDRIKTKYGFYQ